MEQDSLNAKPLRVLISNDDGVHAQGIHALADELRDIAEVTIVAPDRNRSGASNSLTLEQPLRVTEIAPNIYSVQGTPTDCVHFALNELMKDDLPDLVLSGINHGANFRQNLSDRSQNSDTRGVPTHWNRNNGVCDSVCKTKLNMTCGPKKAQKIHIK